MTGSPARFAVSGAHCVTVSQIPSHAIQQQLRRFVGFATQFAFRSKPILLF
jgi:hypothetical protein